MERGIERKWLQDSLNSKKLLIFALYLGLRREEASIVPTHLVVGLWAENVAKHDTTTMPSKHRH